MGATNHRALAIHYLYALLIAISLVCFIQANTNSMPPAWDALCYVDMARSGVIGNPNLIASYAYRPGMPFVSRVVSHVLSVSIEDGFRIVTWISIVGFLLSIFTLSRCFTADYRLALVPMVILAFSFAHVKFPLFFYTLVDVAAYPFIVVAFWALITNRLNLCLLVSTVGLLFKEFLAIPLFLLILRLGGTFWVSRSRRDFVRLAVAVGVGLGVILIPRLCIHVVISFQYIDPINNPTTLKRLYTAWFIKGRYFNILYVAVSYWLPTLLLLTRSRCHKVWADLRASSLLAMSGVYLFLILLLTMYGGTNIFIFLTYAAPIQAVVLALLLRNGVGKAEIAYVIIVTFIYNKIMLNIPTAQTNIVGYLDFYGGWDTRVTLSTLLRLVEVGVYVAFAAGMRAAGAKFSAKGRSLLGG